MVVYDTGERSTCPARWDTAFFESLHWKTEKQSTTPSSIDGSEWRDSHEAALLPRD